MILSWNKVADLGLYFELYSHNLLNKLTVLQEIQGSYQYVIFLLNIIDSSFRDIYQVPAILNKKLSA